MERSAGPYESGTHQPSLRDRMAFLTKPTVFPLQEVLELVPEEKNSFVAETVASYETSDAVMNTAICQIKDSRHLFIAAGIEDMCELYRLKYTIQSPKVSNGSVRNREAPPNDGKTLFEVLSPN